MEITLKKLTLENFKGIKKWSFTPDGKNAVISGDNATGKTSVVDAFDYLLFDKDSNGKSDFAIKTINGTGEPIHNLCHTVGGVLGVDGEEVAMRKEHKEKWTKKRGDAQKALTGHTTDYYIDGVPVKKKEWTAKIADIIDENTFKLLTSPAHFNSLHWKDRREILLQVCGDISDDDVIKSNVALADLKEILGKHSIDDHRKVLTSQRQEINRRLTEIPARIDELQKALANVPDIKVDAAKTRIDEISLEIEDLQEDNGQAKLRKEKLILEGEFLKLKNKRDGERSEFLKPFKDAVGDLKFKNENNLKLSGKARAKLAAQKIDLQRNSERMKALRDDWHVVDEETPDITTHCPVCKQSLPEENIERAKAAFNERKAEKLEAITLEGKGLVGENGMIEQKIDELGKNIETYEKQLEETRDLLREAVESLEHAEKLPTPPTKEMISLQEKIDKVQADLNDYKAPDTSALEIEKSNLQLQLSEVQAAEKTKARMKELAEEEKRLAGEFEDIERQIHIMEQFVVSKVEMLEGKINSKFEMARFALFKRQVNGGIEEVCVTTFNGVPYGSGLNTGAEINVGLDICKTLSEHYGIKAPIWIDGAEAVTEILDIGTQTIKLAVKAGQKELEVNYGE